MAGPGNTPYQVGPGEETDVVIPGKVAFYGETPVDQPAVPALSPTTVNLTVGFASLHTTVSLMLSGLNATGLINRT